MNIGIDGNEANTTNKVGVSQYAYHVLNQLYQLDKKNNYFIYLKNPPNADMPKENSNWHYVVFGPQKFWTLFALPLKLFTQKTKLNLFYSPHHYLPLFCPCPSIVTIHDIGYLQFKDQFTKKDFYQLKNWTQKSISKANHIIAVSQFTKDEIIKTYHIKASKISIAYNGVTPPTKINPPQISIKKPYFLYVGTLKPNKNIPYLIKSFSKALTLQRSNAPIFLIIAGKKGWLYDDIFAQVKKLKLQKKVIFTGFITENDKWYLYKNALAAVIPSLYEGFGIPAIESQSIGTPVIASTIPVFKEILGDSAILTNNLSKTLSSPINQKYSQLGLKNSQKFTWTNTAKSILEVFSKY
jgi:glycosyltransferase involved in cell wall biosynthesis